MSSSGPAADGVRLDLALVRRGLVRSRGQARNMIDCGLVMINDARADRPSRLVSERDRLVTRPDPYVSRGAHKLLGALDDLQLDVYGRALDAGASTGGFSQVLLERGCLRLYAVDVGTGQLAPALRDDPRVVVRERTNLRDLALHHVEGSAVDLVVADVSFISLTTLLAPLTAVTRSGGALVIMVKPQFEVGRSRLGSDGVVRDPALRRAAVLRVARAAGGLGWPAQRCVPSRLPGAAGNREFFLLLGQVAGPGESGLMAGVALD